MKSEFCHCRTRRFSFIITWIYESKHLETAVSLFAGAAFIKQLAKKWLLKSSPAVLTAVKRLICCVPAKAIQISSALTTSSMTRYCITLELAHNEWSLFSNRYVFVLSSKYIKISIKVTFLSNQAHTYIVMELLKGGELLQRIRQQKRFTEIQAARIFQKLLAGVNHIHSKGIVHRDLKPEVIYFLSLFD